MRVYPRLCGGNWAIFGGAPMLSGLSPLVRGKRLRGIARSIVSGSIPACAGETCRSPDPNTNQRVYPRLCGGNITRPHLVEKLAGLSPLVRGKPTIWPGDSLPGGSIPACAGETIPYSSRISSRRVYPRLCGGNPSTLVIASRRPGLSPLVRGKRQCAG